MQTYKIAQVVGLVVLCGATSSSEAQTPADPGNVRPLSITVSGYGGYDTDITDASQRLGAAADLDTDAANAGASVYMSYAGGSPKLNFYTVGFSQLRYYRAVQDITAPLVSGSAGLGAALGRRVRVEGSLQSNYFPQFQFSVLPATTNIPVDMPQPTLDYSVSSDATVGYAGAGMATLQLSSRSALNATYGYSQFKYVGGDYRLRTQSVGAGFSRNLTRYASLRLGYTQQTGEYTSERRLAEPSIQGRNIDAGIIYSRPLSISRRTTIGFATGSTAVDNGARTSYALTGGANLSHRLARRWSLAAAYSRQLDFVGGFNEPIFADSTALNIEGLMWERVSMTAGVGYSNGRAGLDSLERNYNSLQSNARVEVPITTRRMWVFGNYYYYQYGFDESVDLPAGLASHVSRHGVSVGLNLKVF